MSDFSLVRIYWSNNPKHCTNQTSGLGSCCVNIILFMWQGAFTPPDAAVFIWAWGRAVRRVCVLSCVLKLFTALTASLPEAWAPLRLALAVRAAPCTLFIFGGKQELLMRGCFDLKVLLLHVWFSLVFMRHRDGGGIFSLPSKSSDIERGGHSSYVSLTVSPLPPLPPLRFMLLFHVLSRICGICNTSKWRMVSVCLSPGWIDSFRNDEFWKLEFKIAASSFISTELQIILWASRLLSSCHWEDYFSGVVVHRLLELHPPKSFK